MHQRPTCIPTFHLPQAGVNDITIFQNTKRLPIIIWKLNDHRNLKILSTSFPAFKIKKNYWLLVFMSWKNKLSVIWLSEVNLHEKLLYVTQHTWMSFFIFTTKKRHTLVYYPYKEQMAVDYITGRRTKMGPKKDLHTWRYVGINSKDMKSDLVDFSRVILVVSEWKPWRKSGKVIGDSFFGSIRQNRKNVKDIVVLILEFLQCGNIWSIHISVHTQVAEGQCHKSIVCMKSCYVHLVTMNPQWERPGRWAWTISLWECIDLISAPMEFSLDEKFN